MFWVGGTGMILASDALAMADDQDVQWDEIKDRFQALKHIY